MFQAEARWKREAEVASPTLLSRARARPKRLQAFVRVSPAQEAALKAHQAAFFEVTDVDGGRETQQSSFRNDGRLLNDGKLIRYHGVSVPDAAHPAATRLTSLESQYIGQIGVGSVLAPQGCQPAGESLIYLGPTEYLNASEDGYKVMRRRCCFWLEQMLKQSSAEAKARSGVPEPAGDMAACVFFASHFGCWKGHGCSFYHLPDKTWKVSQPRPKKEIRDRIKSQMRRCFDETDPERIYQKLQEEACQSQYAHALIVGYLNKLLAPHASQDGRILVTL
eukprot:symbB.v1.2.024835.t1/scaffold2377.1/size157712/1